MASHSAPFMILYFRANSTTDNAWDILIESIQQQSEDYFGLAECINAKSVEAILYMGRIFGNHEEHDQVQGMVGLYLASEQYTYWSDDIPFETLRTAAKRELVRKVVLSDFVKGRLFEAKRFPGEVDRVLREYGLV